MAHITVSPRLLSDATPASTGPLFGSTDDGASPYTQVLWSSGVVAASVLVANCNVITAADANVLNTLVGRLCKIVSPAGQNTWGQGVCITCYKRDADTYALLRNQSTGYFIEALAAVVEAV